MRNLIEHGRMGSVFAGDSHVVRYWRPQIQGTITENLPSTAEAYQICKCSMRSTFPIPPTSLMTIPSPLDLANNVVKNKHFSGSGGGRGASKYNIVWIKLTAKTVDEDPDNCKRWISRKEIYKSAKIVLTGCKG